MGGRNTTDLTAARKRWFSTRLRGWGPFRAVLRAVAWLKAPRQPIGALGVVFDEVGRVLLIEHVFRTDFPWGLPGGWVEQGEEPSEAVRREVEEELGLRVEVGLLLASEQIGLMPRSTHPRHLGLAYACRLTGGTCRLNAEVVSVSWVRPDQIANALAPFQVKAIKLAVDEITAAKNDDAAFPVAVRR